uniref:Trafficking protein particle complex subunit 5 n=1 Tax=Acrobeloides nanus TaxID=290746 RepID=A0A914EII2_9BILA
MQRSRPVSILDKSLSKGKAEVNLSSFALLFAEMIRYAQNKVNSVEELQAKLAEYGRFVGVRLLDLIVLREKSYKRDVKLLNMLMFVKVTVWKSLFNKEADKLERSNDDPLTVWKSLFNKEADKLERSNDDPCKYFLIEKDPLVNTYISLPKDNTKLNCAAFIAGIVEAFLTESNFPCKVSAHWHKGTAYMIEFDQEVIARENALLESNR